MKPTPHLANKIVVQSAPFTEDATLKVASRKPKPLELLQSCDKQKWILSPGFQSNPAGISPTPSAVNSNCIILNKNIAHHLGEDH